MSDEKVFPKPNVSPNSLWNSSLTSVWESESATWSSTCDNCNSVDSTDDAPINENALSNSEIPAGENKESTVGEFDPFLTPSALWISQLNEMKENFTGSSESSTLSFSLFSDPSQAPHPDGSQNSVETEGKVEIITTEHST
ncbi:UNVERIFIED_CONTAM: hypothetical protein NCL1_18951 [Trichonephila clavipes]